jgi:amino acid permease
MNVLKSLGLMVSLIGAGTLLYPILFKVSQEQLGACGGVTALAILWAIVLFGMSGKKK